MQSLKNTEISDIIPYNDDLLVQQKKDNFEPNILKMSQMFPV